MVVGPFPRRDEAVMCTLCTLRHVCAHWAGDVSCVHTRRQAGATGVDPEIVPLVCSRAHGRRAAAPPHPARFRHAWLRLGYQHQRCPAVLNLRQGCSRPGGLGMPAGVWATLPCGVWSRFRRVRSLMDQPQDSFGPLAKGLQLLCSKSLAAWQNQRIGASVS